MGRIAPVQTLDGPKYLVPVSEQFLVDLHHAIDQYGIIAQRRALARIGFPIVVERGREWWM